MKRLLYLGFTALMMLFAVGSANAQKVTVTLGEPEDDGSLVWTMGSDVPTFTIDITNDDEGTLTLGSAEGNFAVEVSIVWNEDDNWGVTGPDVETTKQYITAATGTELVTTNLTVGGWYDIKCKLVKGDDHTTAFGGTASISRKTQYLNVVDPNAVSYQIQFMSSLNREPLETTEANMASMYYPSISIMAFDMSSGTQAPFASGEFYYVFLSQGDDAVEPTREAYNAADNNGKVKKAVSNNSLGYITTYDIYTDVASAQAIMIKGYLTPMDGDEITTTTSTFYLSMVEGQATAPVFAPATGEEIESGAKVKISNFEAICGEVDNYGERAGSIYYSLNGKTPLYQYELRDAQAGIYPYDEDGIEISGNVGDQITITAIAYAPNTDGVMLASEITTATYTIKEAEASEVTITLDPADGATVQKGSSITITVDGEYEEIDYKWFASKAEAQTAVAAFNSAATGWLWDENPIVGDDLVLAVVVVDEDMKVLASAVAEYTIGGSTEPGVTITFNPADGAEVEEGDTIFLTASDPSVKIVYMMFPEKAIAEFNGWAWTEGVSDEQTGFIYGEQGYPVITKTMKGIKAGYLKAGSEEPESTFVHAGYTVKAQSTQLDVDIEFMTDSYGQARFAKKSDKVRLVLDDYEDIELYYAIVADEDEQPSYVQYGEDLISLADVTTNFTVKAYAVKGIQRSDVFSAEYVLLDIIEPTLEFEATAAKNYPMEFSVKSISYPDIMDKDMMVYYTLDGETEPSDTSFLNQDGDVVKYLQKQEGIWQNYLELTENTTVWAKAYVMLDEGANLVMETPAVKKDVEINTLENPVITPAVAVTEYNAGDSIKVAIEAPEDADVVYYTIDGSEPFFSRTIGNEDLIDSIIFAYYPAWGDAFDTIVVKKSTTVKAIAYKEPAFRMGYVPGAGSDVVSVTFGFKAELTFDPASGSEVYENTTVAINSEDETIDIYYMMFESEEAANAAEWNQEEAELYGEMQPVITKANTTIKAAYVHAGGTAVTDNFFYATYTVKELPAITLTLDPAAGSEVEENTKVTVTASRELVEGEFIVFRMFATKEAADSCADDVMTMEGTIYGDPEEDEDFGYPVITKAAPVLKVGALSGMDENGEWIYNWIVAEYKVKDVAIEASELAGVSVYPNPNNGEMNVVVPANVLVEVFAANGTMVERINMTAGVNALRLENSGIYFVRFTANGQTTVKRVIVR